MNTNILTFVANLMIQGYTEDEALHLWEIEQELEEIEEPQDYCPYCPNTRCSAAQAGICEECSCYKESTKVAQFNENEAEPFCPFSTAYCNHAYTDKCSGSCPLNPDFEG